ncbi:hypothetical protein [Paenibacillus kobensis]|uniref:hypothetical protein n=1 Tax=Paenibacillus kobensis TaxID=59841 RepID=UPI000FD7F19A|nr:hypothetical protein [Paenibacillus kobensis]
MRDADKDREIIAAARWLSPEFLSASREGFPYWLDRAVAAEQRVAELEKVVQTIKDELTLWQNAESARMVVLDYIRRFSKPLSGKTEEERG